MKLTGVERWLVTVSSRNCIVVSIANVKVHFRCRTRRLGDDLHHAACRIAAETCTLRPLQHLDPFATVEFEQVSINGWLVDTIHLHRNGALCGRGTGIGREEGRDRLWQIVEIS